MTEEQFKSLERGDIVRHESSSDSLVVTQNLGDTVIAVRTEAMTNPIEWRLIFKAHHRKQRAT